MNDRQNGLNGIEKDASNAWIKSSKKVGLL
jgi:hypothetical protein